MSSVPQPKSLVIDLEVTLGKEGHPDRIFKVGAARPDLDVELDRHFDHIRCSASGEA